MRCAALDLGSNTFLLLIAEVKNSKIIQVICDESRVTRLGQGVHENRRFHPDAMTRAEKCFSEYKKIIEQCKVDKVAAVSTSAARDVENRRDFLDLAQKYNIPVEVISGQKEAEITFQGSTFELENTEGVSVIDVGGGSTEVIGRSQGHIKGISLDIGSVRLTEMFGEDISKLDQYIAQVLAENREQLPARQTQKVVAVAGTPTTLAAIDQEIEFDENKINSYVLSCEKLKKMREQLARLDLSERKALAGMEPKRADVIVAGVSILLNTALALDVNEIIVSTRGVRYGLALSMA